MSSQLSVLNESLHFTLYTSAPCVAALLIPLLHLSVGGRLLWPSRITAVQAVASGLTLVKLCPLPCLSEVTFEEVTEQI